MTNRTYGIGLLAGVCTLAIAAPAYAQAAAEGADVDSKEIVVTAQNRSQNVQDVPIAIDVISGEALRSAGVVDFLSIQKVAPVVNIVNDTVQTRVTIRGVGSNSNDEAQDQAIAVNIDGEYINRPTVLNAALFDLDRVEVLRGPQGTLYGRNATGGAINFITRKPGRQFGVNGSISYGNYNQVLAEGGVDVPLADVAAVRVSGIYSKRDGFNFHPNRNVRSGDDDTWGLRGSLLLEPTDALTINAAVERVEQQIVIASQAFFNVNAPGQAPAADCSTTGWAELAPLVPGGQCIPVRTNNLAAVNRSSYDTPTTGTSSLTQKSTAFRGRIAYDLGAATLTYTGGYRFTDRSSSIVLSPGYRFNTFVDKTGTQSHELRLNGTSNALIWQLGGFFFRETLDIERGLYRAPPPPFLLGANGGYVNYFTRDLKSRSWAVFGQTDVKFTDKLTAVVGARYTDDKRSAFYQDYPGAIANPTSPFFNTGSVRVTSRGNPTRALNLGSKGDKLTWLIGLNYQPDNDTLVYGKVSTGFKAGGFDSIGVYGPETNTAYEAGLKKTFGANGEHTFNFAGFYYDYKDLQVGVLLDTTVGGQVFNAGKATVWGAEAEAKIALSPTDTFSFSANYLNSKYNSLIISYPVFCVGCSANAIGDLDPSAAVVPTRADGNRPPFAPAWTITAGYRKEIELGSAGTLVADVMSTFKSAYFADAFNFRDSKQNAFTQTDATLTWRPESRKFSIQAFVRNIENIRPISYAGFTSAGPDDIYNWQFGAPRTYGARLSVNF